MNEQTLKPGTRCECRERKCPALPDAKGRVHGHVRFPGNDGQCYAPAVRMVTVVNPTVGWTAPDPLTSAVRMCEPCAQYHESK